MSPRRGFTLVEVMVAIGVIVFLVGLTVSVSVAVAERSARMQTETTLQLLHQAMQEWEATADRQLTWWSYKNPDDDPQTRDLHEIHSDTPETLIITEMLDVITAVPSVRQMIGQIEPDFLYTYQEGTYPAWITQDQTHAAAAQQALDSRFVGSLTVLDAWGMPIYATHPGRVWTRAPADAQFGPDDDGTIHTYNEDRYGVCRNRVIRFVSAGPDRDFGHLYLPDDKAVRDNLYSYPR
jgi:prepilin-type N-terminal cleavage/methylation domain-containing protein